jgi:hypothetical protein
VAVRMETHLLHSYVNRTIHSQPASTNAPLSSISEISPELITETPQV